MKRDVKAVEYTCDGCGKEVIAIGDDLPFGISLNFLWVTGGGGDGGHRWICKPSCAKRALEKSDRELEDP